MTQEQADLLRAKEKQSTKQIMAQEMKIKRAAVLRVRRQMYGPTCAPTLKNQALHFCSFGTIVKLEELERVRTRD